MSKILEIVQRPFLPSNGEGAHGSVFGLVPLGSKEYVAGDSISNDGCDDHNYVCWMAYNEVEYGDESIYYSVYDRIDVHDVIIRE